LCRNFITNKKYKSY